MNEKNPMDATSELPELSQASVDRIEHRVFAQIAEDTDPAATIPTAAPRNRRRRWLTGLGVAAAFVAGVLITPPLLSITQGPASGTAEDWATVSSAGDSSAVEEMASPEMADADAVAGVATEITGREVISNAHATMRVDDIAEAAEAIADLAEQYDGYVEGTDISAAAESSDTNPPARHGDHGWISIRVPSADLAEVVDALGETGAVVSSSTSRQDVTSTAIDLRARVEAAQASVDRLTELMSQSGSVSDLIDAEVALTDRQAQLESYTQQLAALEDQVAMSSLQVQLTREVAVAPAEPDGFADGLLAGWNGLIVSLNALVIAAGFLLPWVAVAGVVVLVIWLIRRRRRARTSERVPAEER